MIVVKVSQTQDLQHGFVRLAGRVAAAGQTLTLTTAQAVRQEALALLEDGQAPETDSGALAASLDIRQIPGGHAVASDAPHAFAAEFGTRTWPSNGWLGLAMARALPQFKRSAGILLKQAVRITDRRNDGTAQ